MEFFGFNRKETSKILLLQFEDMKTRVSNLELEIEKLKTHIISLRGLVNRKLGQDLGIEETQTSKSVNGLDELRKK